MRFTEEYYFKNFEPNETDSSMYSLTSGVVAWKMTAIQMKLLKFLENLNLLDVVRTYWPWKKILNSS